MLYIKYYMCNHENIVPPPLPPLPPRLLPQWPTLALGHMRGYYTFLVQWTKECSTINKLSKERKMSGHKWSTTHRVRKPHKHKMGVKYIQSWKQCAPPVITTMVLWQLMHLGTYVATTHCWYQWTKECPTS